MKTVVILGDSFTYGHGCKDRVFYRDPVTNMYVGCKANTPYDIPSLYCWPALLQHDYPELNVVNLAHPGNANMSMFRNLQEYAAKTSKFKVDLLIFNGTMVDRIDVADGTTKENVFPWTMGGDIEGSLENIRDDFSLSKKLYMTWLYNVSIGRNLALMSLLSCHSFSLQHNSKFLWSMPTLFYEEKQYNKAITKIKDLNMRSLIGLDYSGKGDNNFNQAYLCPDYHANELGHEYYYEFVVKPKIEMILSND